MYPSYPSKYKCPSNDNHGRDKSKGKFYVYFCLFITLLKISLHLFFSHQTYISVPWFTITNKDA